MILLFSIVQSFLWDCATNNPTTNRNHLKLKFVLLGAFPDAFKFQENLKKLRQMIQEPTLKELLKICINPDVGCSKVFKAVVCSFIISEYATYCVACFMGSKEWDTSLSHNRKSIQSRQL